MTQRTPEWFARRAGKFTGSRFADLMATTKSGPSASRRNLIVTLAVERITGTCVETYTNAAMDRGANLEEQARAAYEAHIGEMVEEVDFIDHPTIPMCGVSPDGLVGADGMVELKCPSSMAKHADALTNDAHATEYAWQIQGQLWITGRKWCHAVSYDPRFPEWLRLAITTGYPDESMHARLAAEVEKAEREVQAYIEQFNELRRAA
jgi:putative phage-type endonuclease